MSFEDALHEAKRQAEGQIGDVVREAIEENLPSDGDPADWTWQSLANWANARYGLNLKERDLRKFAQRDRAELEFGREELEDVPGREGDRDGRRRSTSSRPASFSRRTGAAARSPAGSITSSASPSIRPSGFAWARPR